jgi:hypothetical protein
MIFDLCNAPPQHERRLDQAGGQAGGPLESGRSDAARLAAFPSPKGDLDISSF